jgi:predicted Holliday junction resolvase-like endonuclease
MKFQIKESFAFAVVVVFTLIAVIVLQQVKLHGLTKRVFSIERKISHNKTMIEALTSNSATEYEFSNLMNKLEEAEREIRDLDYRLEDVEGDSHYHY